MKPEIRTSTQPHATGRPHPTVKTFVGVGAVLAVITAIEYAILYVSELGRALMLVALALLSVLKFGLVVAYFMHLRFDPKLLAAIFAVGVVLATLITIAVKYINLV